MSETVAWEPACFDPPELAQWRAGEIAACVDCTPSWRESANDVGRCNGVPGYLTRDLVEEDKPVETHTTSAGMPPARIRIAVVAPCSTCGHARVCRMTPGDELVASAELPAMDPALEVSLTATVECMEYVRAKGAPAVKAAGHPHSPETKAKLRAKAIERAALAQAKKAGAAA